MLQHFHCSQFPIIQIYVLMVKNICISEIYCCFCLLLSWVDDFFWNRYKKKVRAVVLSGLTKKTAEATVILLQADTLRRAVDEVLPRNQIIIPGVQS